MEPELKQLGDDAAAALSKVLNLELPENCEIEIQIRDADAVDSKSRVIKALLHRERAETTAFDVQKLEGLLSEAHRT
jgi:hypothetical protein